MADGLAIAECAVGGSVTAIAVDASSLLCGYGDGSLKLFPIVGCAHVAGEAAAQLRVASGRVSQVVLLDAETALARCGAECLVCVALPQLSVLWHHTLTCENVLLAQSTLAGGPDGRFCMAFEREVFLYDDARAARRPGAALPPSFQSFELVEPPATLGWHVRHVLLVLASTVIVVDEMSGAARSVAMLPSALSLPPLVAPALGADVLVRVETSAHETECVRLLLDVESSTHASAFVTHGRISWSSAPLAVALSFPSVLACVDGGAAIEVRDVLEPSRPAACVRLESVPRRPPPAEPAVVRVVVSVDGKTARASVRASASADEGAAGRRADGGASAWTSRLAWSSRWSAAPVRAQLCAPQLACAPGLPGVALAVVDGEVFWCRAGAAGAASSLDPVGAAAAAVVDVWACMESGAAGGRGGGDGALAHGVTPPGSRRGAAPDGASPLDAADARLQRQLSLQPCAPLALFVQRLAEELDDTWRTWLATDQATRDASIMAGQYVRLGAMALETAVAHFGLLPAARAAAEGTAARADADAVRVACESVLCRACFAVLLDIYRTCLADMDAAYSSHVHALRTASAADLGLLPALAGAPADAFRRALALLRRLPTARDVRELMALLAEACEEACRQASAIVGSPLGADDLVPVMAYVVMQARVGHLPSTLMLVGDVLSAQLLMGRDGYALVTVHSAVQIVMQVTAKHPQPAAEGGAGEGASAAEPPLARDALAAAADGTTATALRRAVGQLWGSQLPSTAQLVGTASRTLSWLAGYVSPAARLGSSAADELLRVSCEAEGDSGVRGWLTLSPHSLCFTSACASALNTAGECDSHSCALTRRLLLIDLTHIAQVGGYRYAGLLDTGITVVTHDKRTFRFANIIDRSRVVDAIEQQRAHVAGAAGMRRLASQHATPALHSLSQRTAEALTHRGAL